MKNTLLSLVAFTSLLICNYGDGRELGFPQDQASYERYIAVDDACGWPLLNRLPSGKITMLLWPHPNHGYTEGAVECWISSDDGRHWRKAGVPAPQRPHESRVNHAAGVLSDGTLVAIVGAANNKLPADWTRGPGDPAWPKLPPDTRLLDPISAASHDEGRTWTQYGEIPGPTRLPDTSFVPYGQIAPLADGTLGVMLYDYRESDNDCRVYFFVSADRGKSWTQRSQLSAVRTGNETTWIRLANGDLFAAARSGGDQHVEGFRSTDSGATWKFEQILSLPEEHPASLTALADGRILLTYGVRNRGRWAIESRVGNAAAKAWSAPITLVDLDGSTDEPNAANPARDGGYPSTIALPDRTLLTAYYCRGIPEHRRYHVGVVRWKL